MERRQFFRMTGISRRIVGAALFVFSIGFTARADSAPTLPIMAQAEAESAESYIGSEQAFPVMAQAEAKSAESYIGSEQAFPVMARAEAKGDESYIGSEPAFPILANAEADREK